MSILIKGMEMPECCGYCPFEHKNYCMAKPSLMVESADRHPRCPLISVPPHGRLIDGDALIDELPNNLGIRGLEYLNRQESAIVSWIYAASTIIPAEEGEPCQF
jgi:hypothetical protein